MNLIWIMPAEGGGENKYLYPYASGIGIFVSGGNTPAYPIRPGVWKQKAAHPTEGGTPADPIRRGA